MNSGGYIMFVYACRFRDGDREDESASPSINSDEFFIYNSAKQLQKQGDNFHHFRLMFIAKRKAQEMMDGQNAEADLTMADETS